MRVYALVRLNIPLTGDMFKVKSSIQVLPYELVGLCPK